MGRSRKDDENDMCIYVYSDISINILSVYNIYIFV